MYLPSATFPNLGYTGASTFVWSLPSSTYERRSIIREEREVCPWWELIVAVAWLSSPKGVSSRAFFCPPAPLPGPGGDSSESLQETREQKSTIRYKLTIFISSSF